jgi:hypothetical protein
MNLEVCTLMLPAIKVEIQGDLIGRKHGDLLLWAVF